jgi:hypothetical protein
VNFGATGFSAKIIQVSSIIIFSNFAFQVVLDHENWYFDLDRANFEMIPTFELLYSAREAYM